MENLMLTETPQELVSKLCGEKETKWVELPITVSVKSQPNPTKSIQSDQIQPSQPVQLNPTNSTKPNQSNQIQSSKANQF